MEGRDINGREDILDGNKEALISAVESRCMSAIERARGGAGGFGFQQALHGIWGTVLAEKFACDEKTGVDFLKQNFHRLCMESWALIFGRRLNVRRENRR